MSPLSRRAHGRDAAAFVRCRLSKAWRAIFRLKGVCHDNNVDRERARSAAAGNVRRGIVAGGRDNLRRLISRYVSPARLSDAYRGC